MEMQLRESQDHIEELEKRLAHSAQEKIEMVWDSDMHEMEQTSFQVLHSLYSYNIHI